MPDEPAGTGRRREPSGRRWSRRRRWGLAGLGVAGLLALILALLVSGDHGGSSPRGSPLTRRRVPLTTPTTGSLPASTPTSLAGSGAQPSAVAGKTIVVDPGHNGQNYLHPEIINQPVNIVTKTITCDTTGTQTRDGYTEAAYNFDVALRLTAILRQAGATVVLTRTDNNSVGPCINERAAIGNRANADVGISIHADSGPTQGRGFHVIYPPAIPGLTDTIAGNSFRLALDLRAAYQAGTPMPVSTYVGNGDGLSQRNDLGGLNFSKVPKVFIETGNMQNDADAALLEDPGFRQQAAAAIARGLGAYLAGN